MFCPRRKDVDNRGESGPKPSEAPAGTPYPPTRDVTRRGRGLTRSQIDAQPAPMWVLIILSRDSFAH